MTSAECRVKLGMMPGQWKILKTEEIFKSGFFRLRVDECLLPDGRVMPRYYVVEFSDWVHVLAVTSQGEAVMVRQYRHAADLRFLEVPGGSSDPHTGEAMETAARRELLEETGYEAGQMIYLGDHYPNPALQTNRMHSYLALDCKKIKDQQLDPFEDLKIEIMPLDKVYSELFSGRIKHSLMIVTLTLAMPHLKKVFNLSFDP